jgi:hypothetical protein
VSWAPNISLQRTAIRRFAAAELRRFGPTGRKARVLGVVLLLGIVSCATRSAYSAKIAHLQQTEDFVRAATIRVERTLSQLPDSASEYRRQPLCLTPSQTETLRAVLLRALRENLAYFKSLKPGEIDGGVYGCVDYNYAVYFDNNGIRDVGALHLACGRRLSGGPLLGDIQLDEQELRELANLLSPLVKC